VVAAMLANAMSPCEYRRDLPGFFLGVFMLGCFGLILTRERGLFRTDGAAAPSKQVLNEG
jgi:hypothetical protein